MSRKSDIQKLQQRQYAQATTEAQQKLDWSQKAYDYNTLQAQRGYDTTQASSERNKLADIAGLNLGVWNQAADTGNIRGSYNKYAQSQGLTGIANAFNEAKYGQTTALEQSKYANTTALSQAQQEFENFKSNLELQKQADVLSLKNYGTAPNKGVPPVMPTYEQAMQKYMSGGIKTQQDAQYVKVGYEADLRKYYRDYEAYYGVTHPDLR